VGTPELSRLIPLAQRAYDYVTLAESKETNESVPPEARPPRAWPFHFLPIDCLISPEKDLARLPVMLSST